jgi:hypothetical protein
MLNEFHAAVPDTYWVFSQGGNAQSKNAPLGSGEMHFYSILFQHFGVLRTIGSKKFFPATDFCREKIALNPECKLAYTWWPKNISHRFSLWIIPVKMDNSGRVNPFAFGRLSARLLVFTLLYPVEILPARCYIASSANRFDEVECAVRWIQ